MTTTEGVKPFALPCILCGKRDGGVILITDGCNLAAVQCESCKGEFSRRHLDEVLGKWKKVLEWLGDAPDLLSE